MPLSMLGENASTLKWICNFRVNFLICDMELAKFHEVDRDVLRKHSPQSQSAEQDSPLLQGKTINKSSESPHGILQASK